MPLVVGIDPGITGAVAIWEGDRLFTVFDLPVAGGHVDAAILADLLEDELHSRAGAMFIVEWQSIHPNTAASIAAKAMRGFGRIEGVIAALDHPMTLVTPAKWKRLTGTPKDKDGARLRASQLMPYAARYWPLKRHHGRAEAALIAYWGAHQMADVRLRDGALSSADTAADTK